MAIEFKCPQCQKLLKTSDDKAGRQAKCPGCGDVITIPGHALADTDDIQFDTQDRVATASDDALPIDDSSDYVNSCSACGARIVAGVSSCHHCGANVRSGNATNHKQTGSAGIRPFPASEVISESWRIFTNELGLLIGTFLLMAVLTGITSALVIAPMFLANVLFDRQNPIGGIIAAAVAVILALLAAAFSVYLQTGYLVMQIKIARGQPAELGDLFSGGHYWTRMVLNSILFGLMVMLGYSACIIPGVLLLMMFYPFAHVLVDEDCPGIECLSRAKELTDGNWISLILIGLVSIVATTLGTLTCYVGLVVAIPFINLMFAVAYDRMSRQIPIKAQEQV